MTAKAQHSCTSKDCSVSVNQEQPEFNTAAPLSYPLRVHVCVHVFVPVCVWSPCLPLLHIIILHIAKGKSLLPRLLLKCIMWLGEWMLLHISNLKKEVKTKTKNKTSCTCKDCNQPIMDRLRSTWLHRKDCSVDQGQPKFIRNLL